LTLCDVHVQVKSTFAWREQKHKKCSVWTKTYVVTYVTYVGYALPEIEHHWSLTAQIKYIYKHKKLYQFVNKDTTHHINATPLPECLTLSIFRLRLFLPTKELNIIFLW